MLSTKIRTTIVTLIAGFSIGTATIAPAASQADKNNHTYQKTVGKRKGPWQNTCANAKIAYENWAELAEIQYNRGETKAANEDSAVASNILKNATASGCSIFIVKAPAAAQQLGSLELSQPAS
jgi:hypothetical protein